MRKRLSNGNFPNLTKLLFLHLTGLYDACYESPCKVRVMAPLMHIGFIFSQQHLLGESHKFSALLDYYSFESGKSSDFQEMDERKFRVLIQRPRSRCSVFNERIPKFIVFYIIGTLPFVKFIFEKLINFEKTCQSDSVHFCYGAVVDGWRNYPYCFPAWHLESCEFLASSFRKAL